MSELIGHYSVGIGSDFDGITRAPEGLEDVSRYPALVCLLSRLKFRVPCSCVQIAELLSRGWNKYEIAGLTGGNLLRVMQGAERVAKQLQVVGTPPVYDLYDKRLDLPQQTQLLALE